MSESSSGHVRKLRAWRDRYAQRNALIFDAFKAGMSVIEISRNMGVSRQHIYNLLKKEHPEWLDKSAQPIQKVS